MTDIRHYPFFGEYSDANTIICGKMIVRNEERWICQEDITYLDEPVNFNYTVYLKEPDASTSYKLSAFYNVKKLFENGISDVYYAREKQQELHWLDYSADEFECMKRLILKCAYRY